MKTTPRTVARLSSVCIFLVLAALPVAAQPPSSAALVKELTDVLNAQKLEAIAAKVATPESTYVAALYFAGSQLLVVEAQYSVPQLIDEKIVKKEFRDVYIDLNSASVMASKVFIEDVGANGLMSKPNDNQPFDSYELGGKRTAFDGDWKKQKLAEDEYIKAYQGADERYANILKALIAQAKKAS